MNLHGAKQVFHTSDYSVANDYAKNGWEIVSGVKGSENEGPPVLYVLGWFSDKEPYWKEDATYEKWN